MTLHLGGRRGTPFSGDVQERVVDNVVYVELPKALRGAPGMPAGVRWYSVRSLSSAGKGATSVPGLGQSDPTQILAYLETVSDDVQSVGSGSVRGVETTHYPASLNLGKAVDRSEVPAELRDQLQTILDENRAPNDHPGRHLGRQ